ncbi:QWRF motif-containing protein 7 [Morus notabilis]|uniref:QWRF motif-containing protein 7 n=1 Tax=Morus notabilis TaxID=981085 RepID=UPI000CED5671|nr:QWRF motif-containing protein 7 [Morus notabilis]
MPRATSPGMLSSTSQRYTSINRSKSTTKTRPNYHHKASAKEDQGDKANSSLLLISPNINSTARKIKPQEKDQLGFAAKFLQRGGLRGFGATKGGAAAKPVSSLLPSAWALSPGRSLQLVANSAVMPPDNSRVKAKSNGGGVNGVLKYFRQKKVSPVQEEEFHRFRILHNVLLQWRFANARAEAAISANNSIAQSKLFSVWLWIFKTRNWTVEKRIQLQKLTLEIKLYEILNPQILLLNEWTKLERRNQESVGKLVTKLSGLSVRLPLVRGAKADVMSVYEAMSEAVEAMDDIEAIITRFSAQVESILYMVTELLITKKQHTENFKELERAVNSISTLVAKETSVRAHCIQVALGSVRSQNG